MLLAEESSGSAPGGRPPPEVKIFFMALGKFFLWKSLKGEKVVRWARFFFFRSIQNPEAPRPFMATEDAPH